MIVRFGSVVGIAIAYIKMMTADYTENTSYKWTFLRHKEVCNL
jgi:hypothetical protein